MTRGVYFNGRQRYKPGSYSQVKKSSVVATTLGAERNLAFIGVCQGGVPGQIYTFSDATAAEETLIGGDLLEAAKIAWAPSTTLAGAQKISFIRVNPATQSVLALKDGSTTTVITITSVDYGLRTTGITIKIETGTTANTKKVTLKFGTVVRTADNLATNAAIIAFLNGTGYVTAVQNSATLPGNIAETPLAGGVEGTATTTDWANALDKFAGKRVHGMLPVSSDATVHAMVLEHCKLMTERGKERRSFFGHALGETTATNGSAVLTRALNLNHQRALMATPGIKRNGTLYSSVFTAAALAGMWAGAERTEPLTLDKIQCEGLEVSYTDDVIDNFLLGGVTVIEDVDQEGYTVVQAITTHTTDDDSNYVELLKASLADEIVYNIRDTLKKEFGGKGSVKGADTTMYNRTISLLNKMEKNGWIVAGTDEDTGETIPAYRNVVVGKSGTAFYVDYEASIIDPINFILQTARF